MRQVPLEPSAPLLQEAGCAHTYRHPVEAGPPRQAASVSAMHTGMGRREETGARLRAGGACLGLRLLASEAWIGGGTASKATTQRSQRADTGQSRQRVPESRVAAQSPATLLIASSNRGRQLGASGA